MSFVQRLINVQFDLANGVFAGGGNSLNVTGLRVTARISVPGGASPSVLDAAIYGLSLSQMNQLSTVGTQIDRQAQNKVTVTAGDAQSGMAVVYKGTLNWAYVDARGMPNVALRVQGSAGSYEAVKPVQPTSVKGSSDVAQIMQQLAQQMGLQFENNGVSSKLANVYLSGSARLQALTLAQHAGIEHVIDRGTLAIWPPGQSRNGTVMISPATGMVGYPMFDQASVVVQTIFDPAIAYGGTMQVQSSVTPACGAWTIKNVDLELESQVPHGRWFATLTGVRQGQDQIDP